MNKRINFSLQDILKLKKLAIDSKEFELAAKCRDYENNLPKARKHKGVIMKIYAQGDTSHKIMKLAEQLGIQNKK